jgi:ubiquinone/menaquinone biosynthesis C-methylase UbiE
MLGDLEEFNKIAVEYDKGKSAENVKLWIEETTSLGNLGEKSLILDLDCGTGIYSFALSLFTGGLVCGLDLALGMLKQAL